MSDRTRAIIDQEALHHNYAIVRSMAPHSAVLAMIKSNAYGHGSVAIGKMLHNIDGFGVACLDEAIKLREAGINAPIVVISGAYTLDDLRDMQRFNLHIVFHDPFQVKLLATAKLEKPISAWIKIDTGMHRLGFAPSDFKNAYESLCGSGKITKPPVIMTHLADADDTHKETTFKQVECFNEYTKNLKSPKSIANSAGIMSWPEAIADWNRPGIMLYGISPMLKTTGLDYALRPVMTLMSKIFAIHDLKKGDAIGYGGCWSCPEDMRIGVVAVGYGDGYPRHAKSGTPTLIHDKICPLVGRVSMDLITVDLRPCMEAKIGDDVILWGNGLPAEIVANYADTIAYELVCNVSQRVVFEYQ